MPSLLFSLSVTQSLYTATYLSHFCLFQGGGGVGLENLCPCVQSTAVIILLAMLSACLSWFGYLSKAASVFYMYIIYM